MFAINKELNPRDELSSEPLEFLQYIYSLQRNANFSFFCILTVNVYLITNFDETHSVNSSFHAELRSVKMFAISFTIQST